MLKIGLTGGIGSGKTVVSRCFEALGVPVIDTDVLAREVVQPGQPALRRLVDAFGRDILQDDGHLDRNRLRDMTFADPAVRQELESIIHPAIREKVAVRLAELEKKGPRYCVIVVPLLVETDFQKLVDRVLTVEAPHERRLRWLEDRTGMKREEIEKIMESQATSEERLRVAHDVVRNDGSLRELEKKVDHLHAKYLADPKLD